MIAVTRAAQIDGHQIVAFNGTAQDATFEELPCNPGSLGGSAVLNICYDNALGVDTLFHGAAVVIEFIPSLTILGFRHSTIVL